MLPAQHRMTRSTEFGATVSKGTRAAQPDVVVYRLRSDQTADPGPRVGLIVSKAVGNAVQRHRVSRRLRHAALAVLEDLDPSDRVVIRALPRSRDAVTPRLEQELRTALERIRQRTGAPS
ncbi:MULTISPECIES: ribonuclease P protein component [Mycolicibacterium]|uniref:Ribonuclease P protein component n=2 Tax=Mycolicibacterium TaxID=1866885 RepID=RNPA_MYCVP|nr:MULTISPECIES: ribonuclease P protein component [Mycolicibacterium]A1TI29.1 RecName: Full=Ribonuclease P protein component; Short=RNase P protein; Short=RNaseP protein; AltName: Full=Protein C5 [Mycolicibacterium vanbaalenii PYR-1]ABM16829.1 ribonuclease P protein component [Mycolicibacterium vanbaalenii PYR-1]MCV7129724.1 ribonuclease P protein component [Mycolicibacterium vanbaalenii PYR-1]MDN4522639.1 ribonuclease P protein component [Mycolicibacterium austroafricanum]MDW5609281.1 ribonuc